MLQQLLRRGRRESRFQRCDETRRDLGGRCRRTEKVNADCENAVARLENRGAAEERQSTDPQEMPFSKSPSANNNAVPLVNLRIPSSPSAFLEKLTRP